MLTLVTLYFDFTSPYSYLLWERLLQLNFNFNGVSIKPVVVGKIISEVGGVGPAMIPAKRDYLFKDCLRKANELNLTIKAPSLLPFNPMEILRIACALQEKKDLQISFITWAFRYGWREGNNYEDFEKCQDYIVSKSELTREDYQEAQSLSQARKILKLNIEEALSQSVFGVPTFYDGSEIYWGLESLDYFLNKKDFDREEFERFQKIVNR